MKQKTYLIIVGILQMLIPIFFTVFEDGKGMDIMESIFRPIIFMVGVCYIFLLYFIKPKP